MKKFSTFIVESNSSEKITGIDISINYINAEDLKKYLEVADIFLMDETKEIIKWLIANNKSYIQELSTDYDENAIIGFFNQGRKKIEDKRLQMLWDLIYKVNKENRILEIPTLQKEKDFKSIIDGSVPADYVILQLGTERGKNAIPKRYDRLLNKIINQWNGKSSLDREELKSAAYEGLVWSINSYGKKGNKTKAEDENIVNKTFGQYAAYMIRFSILEHIKNLSHTVRIPISQQKKEKETHGVNRKSDTVSGDKVVGHNDEGNKTLFDFLGYIDTSTQSLDNEDLDKLWKEATEIIDKEFNQTTLDIFYSFFGINGYKKLQNKELADKYNCGPSKITYYCSRVINFIKTNKKIKSIFTEINELMHECMAEKDLNNNDNDPYYINIKENTDIEE